MKISTNLRGDALATGNEATEGIESRIRSERKPQWYDLSQKEKRTFYQGRDGAVEAYVLKKEGTSTSASEKGKSAKLFLMLGRETKGEGQQGDKGRRRQKKKGKATLEASGGQQSPERRIKGLSVDPRTQNELPGRIK